MLQIEQQATSFEAGTNTEKEEWKTLTTYQFLKDYSEEDSIYDQL
ncbi:MAG: hypothetical protein AAF847_10365 [Bacteroidota bacterium]